METRVNVSSRRPYVDSVSYVSYNVGVSHKRVLTIQ